MNKGAVIFWIGFSAMLIGATAYSYRRYYLGKKSDNATGKIASAKGTINVRTSPEVTPYNKMGEYSGQLGSVLGKKKGKDGYVWYQIELINPKPPLISGWAREDVINIF